MVKTRIHNDQGVDEDFLSEKELNDFFDTVVITGTNGRDDTELIITFDDYFPGRGLILAGSGIIVTTGTNFVGISQGPSIALVGSDGITIVSGSNSVDIQGFRTEFVTSSGTLQSQIDTNVTAISDNTTLITTTSGHLQTQIDAVEGSDVDSINAVTGAVLVTGTQNITTQTVGQTITVTGPDLSSFATSAEVDSDIAAVSGTLSSEIDSDVATHAAITDAHHTRYTKEENDAITGSDGITIVSGSNTIEVIGFRTEFVNASGSLQEQIGTGGVTSLNSLVGVIDITGKGEVVVTIEGQNVVISGTPHVAASGIIPVSGTATTISGCFTHVQTSPSDIWNINHNLLSEPVNYITVNSNNTEIIPDTFTINDSNNVTITFVSPQAGKAHIFPCISGSITGVGSGDGTITDINEQAGPSITITGTGGIGVTASGNIITIDGASVNVATVSGCFTHIQSTASDTWNINHNLESIPINYIVVDDTDFEIIPNNFEINDSDNVTITFVAPQSGKAHIFPCISGGIGVAPAGGGGTTKALIGTDGITIISGSSFDTVQGFQTEFVSASGSLQSQLDATVSGINDVFAIRLDVVGGATTYIGEAVPGTLDAASVWRIKKMIETGPDISITWADGDNNFDNIWDDHLILSYS